MNWTRVEDYLPEKGLRVLVWNGHGFKIAEIGGRGKWKGAGLRRPTHWMHLPKAPRIGDGGPGFGIRAEVANDRLSLDIEKEKETVALLMQHFIDGNPVVINGKGYFVVDMKNEMLEENLASVFYLKKAHRE